MYEMKNARQLLTYSRLFFKGSLKSANKTFSTAYGTALQLRKQRRIDNAERSDDMIGRLREQYDRKGSMHLLHSCNPQQRAGNCSEYVDIAIKHGIKMNIPNIWLADHDLHVFLVLAETPRLTNSTLNDFRQYEDRGFWVCDPWFNIHCKIQFYGSMVISKSTQWENEGKEIYDGDSVISAPATQWSHRLFHNKIQFIQMTDNNGKPTYGYELRFQ